MSVQLDEMFDEPPGVVSVVLSHAIRSAGWDLLEVSDRGDRLVWEVDQPTTGPVRLEASITPHGGGARVTVTSADDVLPSSVVPPNPVEDLAVSPPEGDVPEDDGLAEVIPLAPHRRG